MELVGVYLILWFLDVSVDVNSSSLTVHVKPIDINAVHVIVKRHTGPSEVLNYWRLNTVKVIQSALNSYVRMYSYTIISMLYTGLR